MVTLPLIRDSFANRGVKLSVIPEALQQHIDDVQMLLMSTDPMGQPIDYLTISDHLDIVRRFAHLLDEQGFD